MRLTKTAWSRLAVLILTAGLIAFLEITTHLFSNADIAYGDLFYLVLIPATYWYRKHAIYPGILIAGLHIAVDYITTGYVGANTLFRAGVIIVASYLLGHFFEIAGRHTGGLHFRIGDAGAPACDRSTRRLISRLSSRDPDTRYQAAGCLGDAGDPVAVDPLLPLLDDPEVGVRWKAAEALGKLGTPAVEPLTASLRSGSVDVRWMAAVTLGDIGDPTAIPALIDALDDEDTYVRSRAALALGAIGEPARTEIIAALSSGSEHIRQSAVMALGRLGDESSIPPLIEALSDPDNEVRRQARSALGDIGKPAIPPLVGALGSENELLWRETIAAFGLIGKPAIPALTMAFRHGDNLRIRMGAIRALGAIGDHRSADILNRALEDDEVEVREAAREALDDLRKT
ncbi:MAG: HEAT repeat domain-containing protein [Methanomicrobiales archaeon]|nr:HEAT repeat domain-containing protein [Methanomicrobiales archaeon]